MARSRLIKSVVLAGCGLMVLGLVAVAVIVRWTGREGTGQVEQWVGQQLQVIADWQLNPQLRFDDLDYQYPATVVVKNVRLTAEDPMRPGEKIDVLGAEQMTLELARVPRVGEPIVMEKIILKRPVVRMIGMGEGSGRLVGLSNLVKSDEQRAGKAEPKGAKLSEAFQMKLLELVEGTIVYDPRVEGRPAMELDRINTRMDLEKSGDGWYALKGKVARAPVVEMSVGGKVNLDTLEGRDLAVDLKAAVSPGEQKYLPPALQKFLEEHEVSGGLEVTVRGNVPAGDWRNGDARVEVGLTEGNLSLGDYRVPVTKLTVNARMSGRRAEFDLALDALKGKATAAGVVSLSEMLETELKVQVTEMRVEETSRKRTDGGSAKYAGRLNAQVLMNAPMAVVAAKVNPATQPADGTVLPENWGAGVAKLEEARLVELPVIQAIGAAVGKVKQLAGGSDEQKANDRAELRFVFARDEVRFSQIDVRGAYFIVRGDGKVMLDQSLDLTLRGGPLDKVGSLLGETVGGAVAKVSDALATYRVTGKIGQPQVKVEVVGKNAVEKVGGAIKGLFE